ncbi:hypothetical protein Tco_1087964 [Tanacetum coccineum]
MGNIDSVKSILTQSALDALCEKFYIPDVVHPELPGHNNRIRNSPTGKIDINLSQLSVIAAAKVSYFEILCRVHDFVPTIGNFHRFYINSKNKGWMSFSKRAENAPICYTKPLDSLKSWNDHFFWVDVSVFPLAIPWNNDKTLRKDPHPTPAEFNVNVCNYLADNPAQFRKFPEPFLCFVGIIRYYDLDENCYPTFWANDDEGGCSFACVLWGGDTAEANKTKQGEHVVDVGGIDVVANDEVQVTVVDKPRRVKKKRKAADGASGSGLPPKKLREDHDNSGIGANTSGKFVAVLQSLLESSILPVEVGVTAAATVPFVTSSVTLDFIFETGLRTRHPAERFVISSYSSHDLNANVTDDEVTSITRSFMPPPLVLAAASATTIIVGATSAPVHESGAGQVQPSIFRDYASPSMAEADVAGPSQPVGTELSAGGS